MSQQIHRNHTGKVVHLHEMLDAWRIATIVLKHRPHQLGEYQFLVCHNLMFFKPIHIYLSFLITLAGFPTAMESAGISFTTTLPAPITLRSPMVIQPSSSIVAP